MIQRELLPNGTLRLSGKECWYHFSRPKPGLLLLKAGGKETGELGRAPIGEVAVEAALSSPLTLFIDLSEISSVAPQVSDDWTAWFRANRRSVRRVEVLVGSVFVQLIVAVSQHFSANQEVMRIHKDAETFLAELEKAIPGFVWSSLAPIGKR